MPRSPVYINIIAGTLKIALSSNPLYVGLKDSNSKWRKIAKAIAKSVRTCRVVSRTTGHMLGRIINQAIAAVVMNSSHIATPLNSSARIAIKKKKEQIPPAKQ